MTFTNDCIAYQLNGTVVDNTGTDIEVRISLATAGEMQLYAWLTSFVSDFILAPDEANYEWVVLLPVNEAVSFETDEVPFSGYNAYMATVLHEAAWVGLPYSVIDWHDDYVASEVN